MSLTVEPLLTPKLAAQFLGVHPKTFQSLAREHGLKPDGVVGARKRYDPKTLRRFAEVMRDRKPVATAKKRYCPMCEERVNGRECPLCGADTEKWPA